MACRRSQHVPEPAHARTDGLALMLSISMRVPLPLNTLKMVELSRPALPAATRGCTAPASAAPLPWRPWLPCAFCRASLLAVSSLFLAGGLLAPGPAIRPGGGTATSATAPGLCKVRRGRRGGAAELGWSGNPIHAHVPDEAQSLPGEPGRKAARAAGHAKTARRWRSRSRLMTSGLGPG